MSFTVAPIVLSNAGVLLVPVVGDAEPILDGLSLGVADQSVVFQGTAEAPEAGVFCGWLSNSLEEGVFAVGFVTELDGLPGDVLGEFLVVLFPFAGGVVTVPLAGLCAGVPDPAGVVHADDG